MKRLRIVWQVLLGLWVLAGTGCSRVTAPKPVGGECADLTGDIATWEGTWLARARRGGPFSELFEIKVIDARLGILQLAWLEDGESLEELETAQLRLCGAENCLFANMEQNRPGADPVFVFARVKKEDSRLTFWAPDPGRFKRYIVEKKLPGTISENGHVLLGELEKEDLQLLAGESGNRLFRAGHPYVWIKASPRKFLTALRKADWGVAQGIHDRMVESWPGSRPLQKEKFEPLLAQHGAAAPPEKQAPLLSQK